MAQSPYGTVDVVRDKATTGSVVSSLKITYTVGKAIPNATEDNIIGTPDRDETVAGAVDLTIDLPSEWAPAFWAGCFPY